MKQSTMTLAAWALLGSLPGCAAAPGGTPMLDGTRWTLVRAERGVLSEHAAASGVTLVFEPGRVGGHGGCNRYSGDYTLEGAQLRVGPVTSTKMGCPGVAGEVEQAWHAVLAAPLRVERTAQTLVLTAADGQVLEFAPGDAAK